MCVNLVSYNVVCAEIIFSSSWDWFLLLVLEINDILFHCGNATIGKNEMRTTWHFHKLKSQDPEYIIFESLYVSLLEIRRKLQHAQKRNFLAMTV